MSTDTSTKSTQSTDYSKISSGAVADEAKAPDKPSAKAKKAVDSKERSFFREFFMADMKDVGSHLLHNILVPAIKNATSNMVEGAVNMLLYGDSRKGGAKRDASGRISYNSIYDSDRSPRRVESGRMKLIDEVTFESRDEAMRVLDRLEDDIHRYGFTTVADLCTYADIANDRNYTMRDYGWDDLRSADVHQISGGDWLLHLPRPIRRT